ncbi:hypothetical protein I4U23_030968 [Adineta vaga]|nr:hypothetical protein I4U23_030968 [Adineta vaga]
MTDDVSSNKNSSSWNFKHLQCEDEAESSEDFFSALKKNVSKNVYFDEPISSTDNVQRNERLSTIRIDSSDLISRCKQFLPILTDANQTLLSQIKSGENVRIELDSDSDDDDDNRQRIEMNLMFCPNGASPSQSDVDSDDSDDEQINIKLSQEKKSIHIIELSSASTPRTGAEDEKKTDNIVNN